MPATWGNGAIWVGCWYKQMYQWLVEDRRPGVLMTRLMGSYGKLSLYYTTWSSTGP